MRVAILAALVIAVSACASGRGVERERVASPERVPGPAVEAPQLGEVDFETSCAPAVQEDINAALALLHHMMYERAGPAFEAIAQRNPDCGMARWGVAMSLFHPIWPDEPTPEALERGLRELEAARQAGSLTARERAFIDATEAYLRDWRSVPEGERLGRWAEAARQLHEEYPEDVDAAAFYALALLAVAPPEDKTYEVQRRAASILADMHRRAPMHPGVVHYAIHAHDFPPLALEGLRFADAYEAIAPDMPHAAHMPSHIYVRLGQWDKNIAWNLRSAAAADRLAQEGEPGIHWPHAADYLVYGYLQTMQDRKAREILEEMQSRRRFGPNPTVSYAVAAAHVRYALERRAWEEAARLNVEELVPDVDWARAVQVKPVVLFARGVGAARSEDMERAQQSLAELEEATAELAQLADRSPAHAWWAARAAVLRDGVAAWVEFAEGDEKGALALMRRAAEREEAVGKNPVMPGYEMPARELLGDMLLEVDDPGAALDAYRASLREAPNRAHALHGAARAARALDDADEATRYYTRLLVLADRGDTQRPMLMEAQRYLKEVGTQR